jgi:hypothetical protein
MILILISFGAISSVAPAFAANVSQSPVAPEINENQPSESFEDPRIIGQQQPWKKDGISQVWPADGVELWVPLREARYSTYKSIDAADVKAQITGGAVDEELVRITKGANVTSVSFRIPKLEPGKYSIRWSEADSVKTTKFEVKEPILAPGGGNHRHETTTQKVPLVEKIAIAFVIITGGLALLNVIGLWWIPLVVFSAIGALTSVIASIVVFVNAYAGAGINESAWATAFSTPGVWGYFIIAIVMGAMPLTRSMSTLGRLASVGLLSAIAAGAGHSHASMSQTMTITVSVLIALAGATTVAIALNSVIPETVVGSGDRLLIGSLLALMSVASVFIHSMFAVPTGAYVSAYIVRIITALVMIAGLLLIRPWGRGGKSAALSIFSIVVVIASVIVLTQVPPLTAGI